jgi:hypothetical protein
MRTETGALFAEIGIVNYPDITELSKKFLPGSGLDGGAAPAKACMPNGIQPSGTDPDPPGSQSTTQMRPAMTTGAPRAG